MNNKEKIKELDFARTLAVLGVIIAHFSSANKTQFPNAEYNNLSLSSLSVCCFLMISGIAMFYRYDGIPNIWQYFKKQWLRLFPAFYLVWCVFYIEKVCQRGSFIYNGVESIPTFFLTLIGFDGYLLYAFPKGYYITGEWFFGAIIILRLLFPVILRVMKRPVLGIGGVIGLYIISFLFPITAMYRLRTIPYCLFCFMIGWGIQKYKLWRSQIACLLSTIILLCVFMLKLPITRIEIYTPLAGFCLIIIELAIGTMICRYKPFEKLFARISGLSYNIYLLQHIIIYRIFESDEFKRLDSVRMTLLLLFTITVIYMCAKGLDMILYHIIGGRNVSKQLK